MKNLESICAFAGGDGIGNSLFFPKNIAVDPSGNVYVTGSSASNHNAFQITPGGMITEIIDVTGDGAGNTLGHPAGIAVDTSGNVYVTRSNSFSGSDNAFQITPSETSPRSSTLPATAPEIRSMARLVLPWT